MTEDEDAPLQPNGWFAKLPPEAQRELMGHMLAISQTKEVMNDGAEVTIMGMNNADAGDAAVFANTMRSAATAARRQAQALEDHAREYDAIAELITRWA